MAIQCERLFSEVRMEGENAPDGDDMDDRFHLTGRGSALSLPKTYPVEDLVKIIIALERQA